MRESVQFAFLSQDPASVWPPEAAATSHDLCHPIAEGCPQGFVSRMEVQ